MLHKQCNMEYSYPLILCQNVISEGFFTDHHISVNIVPPVSFKEETVETNVGIKG